MAITMTMIFVTTTTTQRNCGLVMVTLFLLSAAVIQAVLPLGHKVDQLIHKEMCKAQIPGLSLAIVKHGNIIKTKGYGLSNLELNVTASSETIYQSGSIGKQFTSALIMLLVEDGTIHLNDTISKYFSPTPTIWKEITLHHLLTHTSGIRNYGESDLDYRLDYTDEDLISMAASFPLNFQPGEQWSYSNTGYVLLGFVIKKATGKFYGDLLKERVFKPLRMTTARVISEEDIIPNRAAGYRLFNNETKNQQYVSPSLNMQADGSLYLTVIDMTKWDDALYSERLLTRSSLDEMWTPVMLNNGTTFPYGFGWFLGKTNNHTLIEHGGRWQGFTGHIVRYVNDQLTIIVLTNFADANASDIAYKIAGLYIPEL